MHRFPYALAGAVAVALFCAGPVLAGEQPLLAKCWSDAELKVKKGEWRPRRHRVGAYMPSPQPGREGFAATPIAKPLRGSIRRVKMPPGVKLVALTFDLCEAHGEVSGYDGRIVDFLRANHVKATFFSGGKWLLSHKQRAQQLLADPLFEIAGHGWGHRDMKLLRGARLIGEITPVQRAFQKTRAELMVRRCYKADATTPSPVQPSTAQSAPLQRQIGLYRFPYGSCNQAALDAVAKAGMMAVQWDVVSGDPARGQGAGAIAKTVLRNVKPGSIIVAHANGRGWNTAKALPLIVAKLRDRGYQFVTVSDLLLIGEPEIASSCYHLRPGDLKYFSFARRSKASHRKRRRKK